MKRLLFVALAFACSLCAAPTTITDNLNLEVGQSVAGAVIAVTITGPAFTTVGGTPVSATNVRIPIDSTGAFSYALQPNAGVTSVFYTLTYQIRRSGSGVTTINDYYSEQIIVPASTTPVSLLRCRVTGTLAHVGDNTGGVNVPTLSSVTGGSTTDALKASNNLSDLLDIPAARGNLGLTTIATLPAQGTGTSVPTVSGTFASDDCVKAAADGTLVSAGATCGTGGGSGSITPATTTALGGVIVPTSGGLAVDVSGNISAVTGTTSGTLAAGNDSRITGAAQKSANLSDLASATTSRTNLGLGTAATQASTAFVADPGANGIVNRTAAGTSAIAIGSDLPTGYLYSSLSGAPTIPTASTGLTDSAQLVRNNQANTYTNQVASATPAVGKTAVWMDSTDKNLKAKNDAGTVSVTVQPAAAVSHQFVTAIGANGAVSQAQPAAADVSGLATSATTDTTSATNITSGTLSASRLPASVVLNTQSNTYANTAAPVTPTGGSTTVYVDGTTKALTAKNDLGSTSNTVIPSTAGGHQFATGINSSGVVSYVQPAFTDITGSVAAAQIPNPSASTLGGVQSLAPAASQFLTGISTSGVPTRAQPATTDLSDAANLVRTTAAATFGANTYDFTGAAHTLPMKSGTTIQRPATCAVGETYFDTSVTAGQNLIYCTATNTWTATPAPGSGTVTHSTGALSSGQLVLGNGSGDLKVGDLSGDTATSGSGVTTTSKVNGTSVPTNSASDQALLTTAAATGSWAPIPSCLDAGGQHLNYNSTTHAFSCGATAGTVGSAAFDTLTSGQNTSATMLVGSGSSLAPAGTGSVTANAFTGTLGAANLPTPTATSLGGVKSLAASLHQFVTSITTAGVPVAAQPAYSDLSGTLPASQIPNPSASTLGGVESFAPVLHQFLTGITTSGVPQAAQPAAADVSGLAASATTDTTSASNISAGTLAAARLPASVVFNNQTNTFTNATAPATPALGSVAIWTDTTNKVLSSKNDAGTVANTVVPSSGSANQFATGVAASGVVSYAQPSFSNLSGTLSASQVPNPSASTLGGIESYSSVLHQWINSISTSGVPASIQPTFSDISGSVGAGQLPNPGSSSLGGVDSYAPITHQFLTGISTLGAPSSAQPAAADLSNGTTGSGSVVLGTAPSLSTPSLGATAQTISVANAGTTGTTVSTVAKLTGAPSKAVITSTSDASGAIGIVVSGAGTSGSAEIAVSGTTNCVFDGATTSGDYVTLSSTVTGDCHDGGATYPQTQILGRVLSTNVAGGTYALNISGSSSAGIPNPSPTTLGGVESAGPTANQWINSISTSGVPALSQPSFSNIAGTVTSSQLPNPSASTLGGVQSIAPVLHQFVNSISTSGVPALSQPAAADVTGLATSATTDTTSATNITSGTLNAARLPATVVQNNQVNTYANQAAPATPSAGNVAVYTDATNKILSAKSEAGTVSNTVVPSTAGANQFATGITGAGVVGYAQPAFSNLSGSASASQLPAPTATTLGGIESLTATGSRWINAISTSGVPSSTQPAFTDISGSVAATQLPNPSATTLGGVQSAAAVTHQWVNSISTSGIPALSQPAFTDITGTASAAQLPNPTASTLGGVQSLASTTSKWINAISTLGVPSATQPGFSDLTGSATIAQVPNAASKVQTVTSNYTATTSDATILCDATAGAVAITLPTAATAFASSKSAIYTVKKIDTSANICSISGNGSVIDNALTVTLPTQYATAAMESNGTQYYTVATAIEDASLVGTTGTATTNTVSIANSGTTGTTASKLAKLTGAPSKAVVVSTTDTGGAIGIVTSGAGTSGNASIQINGTTSCIFDNATTAGDYVTISATTAGDCHDAGASYPSAAQQVVARVLSTNASAGTYQVYLFDGESRGLESVGSTLHQWVNAISTSGTVTTSQPAFTDISGSLTVGQMPATVNATQYLGAAIPRYINATFVGTVGETYYTTMGAACTLSAWTLQANGGTATVKLWKKASGGTTLPTSANVINTSGIALSTGTYIHSTTMTDFTTTAVSADDQIAATLTAASGLTNGIQLTVQCNE